MCFTGEGTTIASASAAVAAKLMDDDNLSQISHKSDLFNPHCNIFQENSD